jgi:hypothetical protein
LNENRREISDSNIKLIIIRFVSQTFPFMKSSEQCRAVVLKMIRKIRSVFLSANFRGQKDPRPELASIPHQQFTQKIVSQRSSCRARTATRPFSLHPAGRTSFAICAGLHPRHCGGGCLKMALLQAGNVYHKSKAKHHLWPVVRGVAMYPIDHSYCGSARQHIGKPSNFFRQARSGQRVGCMTQEIHRK